MAYDVARPSGEVMSGAPSDCGGPLGAPSCPRCGETKPIEQMLFRSDRPGRIKCCKACHAAYVRNRRAVKKTTIKSVTFGLKPFAQTCTGCGEIRMADDFYRGSVICRPCDNARARAWRANNREHLHALVRTWQAENPDRVTATTHRRAARMRENGVYLVSARDMRRLLSSPCFACGAQGEITLDHAIPVARGGRHAVGNLLPLCRSCNSAKGTKTWVEFRAARAGLTGTWV